MSAETWPQPGDAAVILQPWDRGSLRAESVTIERVLKRDIVCSNGWRFNKDRLTQQGGSAWGVTVFLVPADDKRVADTRRKIKTANLRNAAIAAFEDWRRGNCAPSEVAAAFTRLEESA